MDCALGANCMQYASQGLIQQVEGACMFGFFHEFE